MAKCNNPNCNCVDCPNGRAIYPPLWPSYFPTQEPPCRYCTNLLMVIPPEGMTCIGCGRFIRGQGIITKITCE